jgi:hypothetical protein
MLLRRTALILALSIASVLNASAVQQPKPHTPVWIGRLCDGGTRPSDRTSIGVDHTIQALPKERICVDRGTSRIDFQVNSLKIIPYKWGGTALQFNCLDKEKGNAFLSSNSGKNVAFVVGDKAMNNFTISETQTQHCGWQMGGDLRNAIAMCRLVAKAWAVSPKGCTALCDSSGVGGAAGICVVHK